MVNVCPGTRVRDANSGHQKQLHITDHKTTLHDPTTYYVTLKLYLKFCPTILLFFPRQLVVSSSFLVPAKTFCKPQPVLRLEAALEVRGPLL